MFIKPIKILHGYTISQFENRYLVYVAGDEIVFNSLPEAETFITSGEAKKIAGGC